MAKVAKADEGSPLEDAPPVGDFFAPFFTVHFITKKPGTKTVDQDGKELATATGGESETYKVDHTMRNYATSLEIVSTGNGANVATLTMEPPFYDAVDIIESQRIQRDSVMVCQWGWLPAAPGAKKITSAQHFFIVMKPSVEMSGSDITITITGVDLLVNSATKRETRTGYPRTEAAFGEAQAAKYAQVEFAGTRGGINDQVEKTVFPTDLSILEHLAKKNGNLEVKPTLVPPNSSLFKTRPLNDSEPLVLEQNELDWDFFKGLCRKNKCDFFTLGNKVFLGDRDVVDWQKSAYRLIMYQQPRDGHDIVMLNFSTSAKADLFQSPESVEVRQVSVDPDTGVSHDTAHDPAKMKDKVSLGKKTLAGRDIADGKPEVVGQTEIIPKPKMEENQTCHVSVPHNKTNRDEHVASLPRAAAFVANMNASATIPGVPTLLPLMIVQVSAGFPKTFDGPYRVMKATHRLGDGYEMELELLRDTSSVDPAGYGVEPVTPSDPPMDEGGGEVVGSTDENGKPVVAV